MFVLNSNITIGKFKQVKPHGVKVEKSIFRYADKATIKVPITARISRAGEVITAAVETAKLIEEGQPVNIELGYNGQLKNEFKGFVSRVNFTSPCEIECEGYSYLLRKKTFAPITFKNAELLNILKHLVNGLDIVLDKNIPGFKIAKLVIQNHNGCEVLEEIKKISDNTIRFYFTGNVLYAGLVAISTKNKVKYRLGWNVIKDNNLKLREAKNQQVTVRFRSEKKDGTKLSQQSGNGGEVKEIVNKRVQDEATLKLMADAKLQQLSYNGYEGKITTFLQPYAEPGDVAVIEDRKYPERNGNYLIESVTVTYGMSGARREVNIGLKL